MNMETLLNGLEEVTFDTVQMNLQTLAKEGKEILNTVSKLPVSCDLSDDGIRYVIEEYKKNPDRLSHLLIRTKQ